MPGDRARKISRLGLSEQMTDKVRVLFYLGLIAALFAIAIKNGGVWWAMFFGGFVGLVSHWVKTYKCLLVLPPGCDENDVQSVVERMGYRQLDGNAFHYRVNLPRLLYFNHQDLLLEPSNGSMVMTGQKYVLQIIGRRLVES